MTKRDVGPGEDPAEAGTVLLLVAMCMFALATMVALVTDLGQLRADRRDNQRNTDLAAFAAGYYLSGQGSGSSAVAKPMAACSAAIASVKTNVSDFPASANFTPGCSSLPFDSTTCETWPLSHGGAPMPMETLTTGATGSPYVLTLKYPVPASEINDARLAGGASVADGTDQCARMLVRLHRTRSTSFARIVGVTSQQIDATAVVRSTVDSTAKSVAAVLLLERENCAVLDTGGQGKVVVQSPSNLNPGRVQADSAGLGTCTTNANSSGYVIYAASSGNSRIEVEPTADGKPGVIGIYGLTPSVGGRGGAVFTSATASNGLSVDPVAGPLSSRRPVDEKYNPSTRAAITDLHARAWSAVTSAAPAGATVVNGLGCTAPAAVSSAAVVYVDCAEFIAGAASAFPDATHVYFTGKVTVATGMSLSLPAVERVYIRGCQLSESSSTNCGNNATGSNAYALRVDGTLLVNTSSYAECPTTTPPAPPSTATLDHRIAELATVGGPIVLSSGSSVAMCQTSVYAGRNASTYAVQQLTSGGINCSSDLPCPASGTGTGGALTEWVDEGYLAMPSGGGSGSSIYWSAPNRTSGAPTASNPFDDLALWGESSRASFLKGTGSSRVAGVFFLPNSFISLLGQGSSNQPLNAQIITRGLSISGQGTVVLKPNPDDSVASPSPGGYSLIR